MKITAYLGLLLPERTAGSADRVDVNILTNDLAALDAEAQRLNNVKAEQTALDEHRTATPIDHPAGSVNDAAMGNRTIGDVAGTLQTLLTAIGDVIKAMKGTDAWNTTTPSNMTEVREHIDERDNPHAVTAEQVGLGNANNTADADKPVSTATQEALTTLETTLQGAIDTLTADKADKVTGGMAANIAAIAAGGGYADSGKKFSSTVSAQSTADDVPVGSGIYNFVLSMLTAQADFQGLHTFFGTQAQVEAQAAASGDTAIAYTGELTGVTGVLKGTYDGSAWAWATAQPAPANGMWILAQHLLDMAGVFGIAAYRDDGANPAAFDTGAFPMAQPDNIDLTFDSGGQLTLREKILSTASGTQDVLYNTDSERILHGTTQTVGMALTANAAAASGAQTTANNAATAASNAATAASNAQTTANGKATAYNYTYTIPTATAAGSANVAVSGVLASDTAITMSINETTSTETNDTLRQALSDSIDRVESYDGGYTVYYKAALAVQIPMKVWGVR